MVGGIANLHLFQINYCRDQNYSGSGKMFPGIDVQEGRSGLKIWGGYSWDIRDPDIGISRTKTLCKWPCSVVLDRERPGCSGMRLGTSRISKNFMQENFGLIFRSLNI